MIGLTRGMSPHGKAAAFAVLLAVSSSVSLAHKSTKEARLPMIGQAAEFTLTDQDGKPFALRDLRGKAVAVTFL